MAVTTAQDVLEKAKKRFAPHALDILDQAKARIRSGEAERTRRSLTDPELIMAPPQVAASTAVDPLVASQVRPEIKSIPRFIQAGANQSLTGYLARAVTGQDVFQIDPRWQPNRAEQIGAGAASFMMPADIALMGAGGAGVGALSKIPGIAAKLTALATAKPYLVPIIMRTLAGGGSFGVYEAGKEGARQAAYDEPFNPGAIGKAAGHGAVIGAVTGGAAGAAAPLGKVAEFGAEVGALGTTGAALERRMPTVRDYTDAAAMILALKAGNAVKGAMDAARVYKNVYTLARYGKFTVSEAKLVREYWAGQGKSPEEIDGLISEAVAEAQGKPTMGAEDVGKPVPQDVGSEFTTPEITAEAEAGRAIRRKPKVRPVIEDTPDQNLEELQNKTIPKLAEEMVTLGYSQEDAFNHTREEMQYVLSNGRIGTEPDQGRIGKTIPPPVGPFLDLATVEGRAAEARAKVDGENTAPVGENTAELPTTPVTPSVDATKRPYTVPVKPEDIKTYEEWAKEYRDAFKNMTKYTLEEAGSSVFSERMAALADAKPEWLDRFEAEEEAAAGLPPIDQTPKPKPGFKVGDWIVNNQTGTRFQVESIEEDGTVRAKDYRGRIPIVNVIFPENVKNYRLEGEEPQAQNPQTPVVDGGATTPTSEVKNEPNANDSDGAGEGSTGEGSGLPNGPNRPGGGTSGTNGTKKPGGGKGPGGSGTPVPKDESTVGDSSGEPGVPGGTDAVAGQPTAEAPGAGVSGVKPDKLVPESPGGADPERPPTRDTDNYNLNDKEPITLSLGKRKAINEQVKKLLEKNPEDITDADREILRQYTGQGGIAKGTVESLNQHYTDYTTIRTIYDAIDRMGFKYSKALEPSVGSGNFVGHRPGVKWTTVDIDKTNYEVVRRLYPDGDHYHMSYEEYTGKGFDLVISNVPFSEQRGRLSLTIRPDIKALHDFYFVHSLDRVRPNGIIAFITSKGTMDKLDSTIRKQIVAKGDVIGAFRLPQGQFADNAHTEVTTDVIFIQRRPEGTQPRESARIANDLFVNSSKTADNIALSQYYQEYPEKILGDMTVGKDKMYGGKPAYVVAGPARLDAMDLGKYEKYQDKVDVTPSNLPTNSKEFRRWAAEKGVNYAMSDEATYKFRLLINGDKVEIGGEPIKFDDVMTKGRVYTELTGPEAGKILLLDKIAKAATAYQENQTPENQEAGLALIKQYAEQYKNHPSTDLKLKNLLKPLGEDGIIREAGAAFDKKFNPTDVFLGKTRYEGSGKVKVDANSPVRIKAMASENARGEVDLSNADALTVKDLPELLRNGYALSDYSEGKPVVTNDILYYAGNIYSRIDSVNRLLKSAAAKDPAVREALDLQKTKLEAILPQQKSLGDIYLRGNETWFYKITEGLLPYYRAMNKETGQYEWKSKGHTPIPDAFLNQLNNKQLVRRKADDNGIPTETIAEYMERVADAEEKVADFIQKLKNGISNRPELQQQVVDSYNRSYRNYVKPDYSKASYLIKDVLEEIHKSSSIKLRDYQIAWVVQAIYEGRGVNAHDVGLGKTFAAITLGRALKKRGAAQKPLYVVPAKTIQNWEREIKRLFPKAKVVSLGKLSADKREQQLFDVANQNADFVLIGHEGFEHINLTVDQEMKYINDVIAEHIDDPSLKGRPLALLQEKIEKYKEALLRERRNPRLTFDKLGFDAIVVDEAHNYKNIGIRSELVKFDLGVGFDLKTGKKDAEGNESASVKSARSYDLRFKANYISENNNGKNVFLLTATPTQNKPMEIYTMLRHMGKDVLKEYGFENDRDFANTFLDLGTEQNAEGTHTEPILIGIRNAQEFRGIVNRYFDKLDVLTSGHADLIAKVPKMNEITHYFEQSKEYAAIAADLTIRYGSRPRPPKKGDDTVIAIYTGGRAASVDPRTYGGAHANVVIRDRSHNVKDDKIEFVIQNVGAALKNNPNGGHLIFMDRPGHSNVLAGKLQTDVHTEMKQELMRRYGFKANQIAIINGKVITNVKTGADTASGDRDIKKQEIADAYNEGRIKVVIGATGSMGEGMNLQVKTTDIWHTDIPYKPGEFQQRNGRGVRFGNENKEVNIHYLLMQGTYDTMSMGIIHHKKGWNEAFWDKEVSDYISTREEMSSGGMPSQEQIAIELEPNPAKKHGLIVNYHLKKLQQAVQTEASVGRSLEFKVKEETSTIAHYEKLIENLPKRIEEHKPNEKIEDPDLRAADFKGEAERLEKLKEEYPKWVEEHQRRLADIRTRLEKVRDRQEKARAAMASFASEYLTEKGEVKPTSDPLTSPADIKTRKDNDRKTLDSRRAADTPEGFIASRFPKQKGMTGPNTSLGRGKQAILDFIDSEKDGLFDRPEDYESARMFIEGLHPSALEGVRVRAVDMINKAKNVSGQISGQNRWLGQAQSLITLSRYIMDRPDTLYHEIGHHLEYFIHPDDFKLLHKQYSIEKVKRVPMAFTKRTDYSVDSFAEWWAHKYEDWAQRQIDYRKTHQFKGIPKWLAIPLQRALTVTQEILTAAHGLLLRRGMPDHAERLFKTIGKVEPTVVRPEVWETDNPDKETLTFQKKDGTEERYAGLPTRHIAEGVEKVMSALWNTKAADDIKKVFAPAARGAGAKATAGTIRENAAEMSLTQARADKALEDARDYFSKASQAESYDFMDAVETGRSTGSAEMDMFAGTMRELLDTRRDEIIDLGTGKLQNFIENYFPHIWKDPNAGRSFYAQFFAKRPFEGKKAFLKKRTIATIADGLAAGLEPVSDNPVDLVMLKLREMDKYLMAHRTLAEMKTMRLAKFVNLKSKPPDGWVKIDDAIGVGFRKGAVDYGGGPDDMVPSLVIAGHYYAPEQAALILHNYLSPGLESSSLFKGYRTASNVMNMFQLGFSAFHLGFTSMDASVSKTALGLKQLGYGKVLDAAKSIAMTPLAPITNVFQGNRLLKEALVPGTHPELEPIVKAMLAGGGRIHMDKFYHTDFKSKMVDAFKQSHYWGAVWRSPFAAVESLMWPILEYIVPRQKLGVFSDIARMELERNPRMGHAELRRTMQKAWDSVDNRLGQLVYDNLFWNKITKDLAMASVRSVGWNLGTIREIVGGGMDTAVQANRLLQGKKPEMTYRMSYILAVPMVVGMAGAITQYLMSGQLPGHNKDGEYEGDEAAVKDLFFPRTGETDEKGKDRRVVLPSYVKDVYHYYKDPVTTVTNKVHPALSTMADMFRNEDFYGTEIRHADDPLVKQLTDLALFGVKSYEPFAVRGFRQNRKNEESFGRSAMPFFGITPAPSSVYKTKAEEIITEYQKRVMPEGPRTQQAAEIRELKQSLRKAARKQAGVPEELRNAVREGKITVDEAYDLLKYRDDKPIQTGFRSLPMAEALKVWEAATPEEKNLLIDGAMTKTVNFFENQAEEDVLDLKPEVMKMVADIKRMRKEGKK